MKIFRTEAALLDDSMRRQLLDLFIVRMLERRELTDPLSLDILAGMCESVMAQNDMLDAIVGLLDNYILIESENGLLTLLRPCEAQIQAGLFTEDSLDLAPEGTQVLCLADSVIDLVEEKGIEEAAKELMESIMVAEAANSTRRFVWKRPR